MKWRDVDFTIGEDYFKVQHQKGTLIVYGMGSQCLLHWGAEVVVSRQYSTLFQN